MQLPKVWIRNYTGSVSYPEKVAPLHPSKFGNVQGKCFHNCWSFCHFRSSTSPCPEGSFLAPCSRPWLPTRSCYDVWRWCLWPDSNNAPQESIWMGRQTSPQGGTRFRMLRAQFWTLAQSKYISEGTQKWTLLGSKVVPPGGPVFGPFILSDVLKLCKLLVCKMSSLKPLYTNSIRGGNLELGRPVFACLIFLDFFGPKNRPFWMTGRSKSRPNDHLLDSWAGRSACDRPGIPLPPRNKDQSADAAKNHDLIFLNHFFWGVPKFEKLWRIRFQSNHFRWNNSAVISIILRLKNR